MEKPEVGRARASLSAVSPNSLSAIILSSLSLVGKVREEKGRRKKIREQRERERVRRKKIQARKQVEKSRNTVLSLVAPECGKGKVGSLKRRVCSHLGR